MGGLARGRAFAADSLCAMQNERFFRCEGKLKGEVPICSLEGLGVWPGSRRFGAPAIDPDMEAIGIRTGLAQTGPADFFRIMKTALAEIAHGEMGQVELGDGPLRREGSYLLLRHAPAEEGELIAERAAVFCRELPRVVPPFRAKGFMRSVIAWKGIAVAFRGDGEFLCPVVREPRQGHEQTACQEQNRSEGTPQFAHG